MLAALGTLVASTGWRGNDVRAMLGVPASADAAAYEAAGSTHPVFEVVPTPAA